MAFETWNPPIKPVVGGTALTLDFNTLTAPFGDGYEQTADDGINPDVETWTLSWPGILDADGDAIETFVRSKRKSVPFWYRVPGRAAAKRYKFTSFSRPQVDGQHDGLTVGIREVRDIE